MRKLSFTLLLIALSFTTMKAGISPILKDKDSSRQRDKKTIIFKRWNHLQRTPMFIPIMATQGENDIEIQFLQDENSQATFQVKDCHENVIYQDVVIPDEQEIYKIDLDGFKVGKYELLYIEEDMAFIGEIQIE